MKVPGSIGICLLLSACSPLQQLQGAAAAGGSIVNSVSATSERTSLSAAELRQLQTRDFQSTKASAFASVMTVLLDTGYRVVSADLESGLITATAQTTERLKLDPTGLARSAQTPLASAYIEERDAETARVRIVFSLGTSSTGQLATSGERAIHDPGVYGLFYSRLEAELAQRPAPREIRQPAENGPSEAVASSAEDTEAENPISLSADPEGDPVSSESETRLSPLSSGKPGEAR